MFRLIGSILFICAMFHGIHGIAQVETGYVIVEALLFEGLKRTKSHILNREIDIQPGDTILVDELMDKIAEGSQRLLNTKLFAEVNGNVKEWSTDNRVVISYQLREQFFLGGYFIFDLADRNFNVWWEEQNHRLDRIDYGLRISHDNITGRGDELSLGFTLGFTRKIDLAYDHPGINRARTIGLKTRLYFAQNRETNFTTEENKFVFFRDEEFQLQRFRAETRWTYRPRLDYYHYLDVKYYQNKTSAAISSDLNSNYFLNGKRDQKYVELGYSFIVDKRIQKPFTLQGWYARINFIQSGLGFFKDRQSTILRTTLAKYILIGQKWNIELFNRNQVFISRDQQAYINNRAIGDRKDFLIGYELYALDGTDFAYLKTSLRFNILDRKFTYKGIKWLEEVRLLPVPIQLYLTLNNDIGYVREEFYFENNPLANQALWGGGVGLDIVVYYDKIFQVQYSVNHLLEKGIFLHYKQNF